MDQSTCVDHCTCPNVGCVSGVAHCSVKIDDIPIPSEGQNSTIYLLAADWAHGRRDLCGLTRLPVCVGPL